MPEPLDPKTLSRLQATQAKARMIRTVDLSAIGPDTRVGTLHIRPRPVEKPGTIICRNCGAPFVPDHNARKLCDAHCANVYRAKRRAKTRKFKEDSKLRSRAFRAKRRAEKEGAS